MISENVTFVAVAKASDVAEDSVIKVVALGRKLAVYNFQGAFYATDEICSHAEASLADGFMIDDTIECPLHGACFSIKTGKALSPPATEPIGTYPVKVENEEIHIGFPST